MSPRLQTLALTLHDCDGVPLDVKNCDILDVGEIVGIAEDVSVDVSVGVADGDGSSTVRMTLLRISA